MLVFPLKGKGRVRLSGPCASLPDGEHGALTFDDVRGDAIEHLKLNVAKVNWFSTYRCITASRHRFREGRAFLLGDAAHIHSPVGGQGMNTGIGDAVNLAWKLAAVLKEDARGQPARHLRAGADRLCAAAGRHHRSRVHAGDEAGPSSPGLCAPGSFRCSRPCCFGFRRCVAFCSGPLSQIGVNYRNSPLSAGAAGAVRGGDRLPWVETEPGQDNFAPLTSLAWQVHVYGEPRRGVAEACAELRLPLHLFAWQPGMRRAGLEDAALYLIRPDGYVALADPHADPERLRHYLVRVLAQEVSETNAKAKPRT